MFSQNSRYFKFLLSPSISFFGTQTKHGNFQPEKNVYATSQGTAHICVNANTPSCCTGLQFFYGFVLIYDKADLWVVLIQMRAVMAFKVDVAPFILKAE